MGKENASCWLEKFVDDISNKHFQFPEFLIFDQPLIGALPYNSLPQKREKIEVSNL